MHMCTRIRVHTPPPLLLPLLIPLLILLLLRTHTHTSTTKHPIRIISPFQADLGLLIEDGVAQARTQCSPFKPPFRSSKRIATNAVCFSCRERAVKLPNPHLAIVCTNNTIRRRRRPRPTSQHRSRYSWTRTLPWQPNNRRRRPSSTRPVPQQYSMTTPAHHHQPPTTNHPMPPLL